VTADSVLGGITLQGLLAGLLANSLPNTVIPQYNSTLALRRVGKRPPTPELQRAVLGQEPCQGFEVGTTASRNQQRFQPIRQLACQMLLLALLLPLRFSRSACRSVRDGPASRVSSPMVPRKGDLGTGIFPGLECDGAAHRPKRAPGCLFDIP